MNLHDLKTLPPIERLIQTNFNPMAVVDIKENTNIAKAESEDHAVFLNVLGTMKISKLEDLSKPPVIGKDIIDQYPDEYLEINEENEDFYIFTRNFISLSIYEKINNGKDMVLLDQYLDSDISRYLISASIDGTSSIVNDVLKSVTE